MPTQNWKTNAAPGRDWALECGYSQCAEVLKDHHAYRPEWVRELLGRHCVKASVLPQGLLDVVADYSTGIRERTAFPGRESDNVDTRL